MSVLKSMRAVGIVVALAVAMALAQSPVGHEELTRKELKALVASAKKPADHERIAAYYRAEAQQLEVKDQEHKEDLAEYLKNSSQYSSKYPTMGDHCRSLAGYYKLAADQAFALAEMHEKLAQQLAKQAR